MKIKRIATAVFLPAAITGITVSSLAVAQASTGHPGGQIQSHPAAHHNNQRAHGSARRWLRVRPGDTLSRIAGAHRMTWQALYATPPNFRHLANPDYLTVGQRLRIPANPKLREAQFAARFAALQQGPVQGSRGPSAAQSSPTAGMSSFQQCVAWRESGNNPTVSSAGLYGILPSTWASLGYSGTAGQASVAQQNAAFHRLYAQYGTQPWAPYDGC